jgi:aminopeptidase
MAEDRVVELARLLVEECVDVQPGWQVVVLAEVPARPLAEEVSRALARRGAYSLTRLLLSYPDLHWLAEAPEELVATPSAIEAFELERKDAYIAILAPENTQIGSAMSPERLGLRQQGLLPYLEPFLTKKKPWAGTYFPTQAVAQDAGMTLRQFEDFYYGACLVDWGQLEERMRRIADRFDLGREVRIVAGGTDLRLSLDGRQGEVDALGANMPGGEVFYCPVEDSAEGEIAFSEYPACDPGGDEVEGVRLTFEAGRIVEASAAANEDYLLRRLDLDEGARRLGELGIGCNPGIQRHMRNTLFDEKIEGTVHLAIGAGFPFLGGTNVSALHWDMVKDLRRGGRLELDGEVVQENGRWLVD